MTNGEHNMWLGEALQAVPEIKNVTKQLSIRNAIDIAKELHNIGEMSDVDYVNTLKRLLSGAGFTIG